MLQSNLDYPDSLGPHAVVRIIENMNINEEQIEQNRLNQVNDISSWNNTFTTYLKYNIVCMFIFTISSACSFLSFMERTDRLR